jgi:uncharacterized protein YkwD
VVGEPASFVSLVSNGRTLCGSVACAAGDFQIRNAGRTVAHNRQLGLCPVGAARASTMTALEQEVFNLVNVERAAAGLYTLAVDERLVTAARAHSQDMAYRNYFAHDSPPPNPTTFSERITMNGYNWSVCAENIAAGQATAAAVMNTWMNSPGHRANILTTACCDLGVGYATNPQRVCAVLDPGFGRLAGSPPCGPAA